MGAVGIATTDQLSCLMNLAPNATIVLDSCSTGSGREFQATIGLMLLKSNSNSAGSLFLVVSAASAFFGYNAYRKGSYEPRNEVKVANRERYSKISDCLRRLKSDDFRTARALSLRLDIVTIQERLTDLVADPLYSASLSNQLQEAKAFVLE